MVTGAGGFVGRHLSEALREDGRIVLGVGNGNDPEVACLDIRDRAALEEQMSAFAPDAVVHLAARTYLPEVYQDPVESFSVNVLGTLSVLEATANVAPGARVLLVSTCVVYGDPDAADLPLREESDRRSVHPYGIHKVGLELLGERFRDDGLDVVVARPFNHIGPGMDPRISIMHFATQIVAAEQGEGEPVLRVGNLDARRDFLDVSDVVAAYILLLDHPAPPTPVNICRGVSTRVGDVLDRLISAARVPLTVERDAERYRPLDVPDLYGDPGKLRGATGWEPAVDLDQTLADILESVRARSAAKP